jgi:hypothetical protein
MHKRGCSAGLADGIVITPSHNPAHNGGFRYNPPNGGPADTNVTGWIEARANVLLEAGQGCLSQSPSTTSSRIGHTGARTPLRGEDHGEQPDDRSHDREARPGTLRDAGRLQKWFVDGLKVIAESEWFAARPSGTEDIYKIYAESFRGEDHLRRIVEEAQAIVDDTLGDGIGANQGSIGMSRREPTIEAELETLQRETFGYFLHETDPANGLVLDKTAENWPGSIAATGLALAAYPVAVERGFMWRVAAVERTLATLRFFWNSPHGPEPDATGYQGFYYHFLDLQTGRRLAMRTIDGQ